MTDGSWSKLRTPAALQAAALAVLLCLGLPALGQSTPSSQTPPKQSAPAAPSQAPAAAPGQQAAPAPPQPAVNKEEEDAYKAFYELTTQQNTELVTQGEAFLAKFPDSRYRSSVYARLMNAYLSTNQPARLVTVGEKALAENPDNVDVLAIICTIIPRTVDPRSLDADQKFSEAERYARHAIELINRMQMPEGKTPEQFEQAKAQMLGFAHYGLGLVNYMRGNTAGSVDELEQATKLDPQPEPLEFYLLGSGDFKLKKFSEAAAAFDRCATAQWAPQWQARCKKGEADAKQAAAPPASAKP
ncbi:MAG TPA: hypothetical protein VLW54_12545 [Candidatus Acidoferrales bacterium]|nr:hypothetical protein [Candidatus Acidoferrales bacterium]